MGSVPKPGAVADVRGFFDELGYAGFFILGARTYDIAEIAADIVFYAIAAGAFTITDRAGLRDGRHKRERVS